MVERRAPLAAHTAKMSGRGVLSDERDAVYAIVIPELEKEHKELEKKQTEFTEAQARAVDFSRLPIMCNHSDRQIGEAVAARVRDMPGRKPRVEAVFQLSPERDTPDASPESQQRALQRNLLMGGAHRDVSLGHAFWMHYCGNVMKATLPEQQASFGAPGFNITKRANEISTCHRGRRKGSHILEYLPCARSLRRSSIEHLEQFAKIYRYPAPPRALQRNTPEWRQYVDVLARQVRQRRKKVMSANGYRELLGAHGTYAASADADELRELIASSPWHAVRDGRLGCVLSKSQRMPRH